MFRLTSLVVGRMILTTRLLKIIVVQHHFKRHFDINIICMYGSYYYWGKQVHVYVVIHFCDSLWVFLSGSESVQVFYCLFIYSRMQWCRKSSFQEGSIGIPLTGVTLLHCCACPKSRPIFPASYVVVSFVFSEDERRLFLLLEMMTITV